MNRAGDLLIEQARTGGAIDPEIGADAELSEEAGAGIARECGLEVFPAGSAWAATTSPRSNRSSTPVTLTPRGLEGTENRIVPLSRILDAGR